MGYYDLDAQLERLRTFQDDWDTYGGPAPSAESIARVERVIQNLLIRRKWIPRRIGPAGEGGTYIMYRGGENDCNYCDMAFLNDGTREVDICVGDEYSTKIIDGYPRETVVDDIRDIAYDLEKALRYIQSDVLKEPNCTLKHLGACNSACGDY